MRGIGDVPDLSFVDARRRGDLQRLEHGHVVTALTRRRVERRHRRLLRVRERHLHDGVVIVEVAVLSLAPQRVGLDVEVHDAVRRIRVHRVGV